MSFDAWLPPGFEFSPRTEDRRLTGVRIPYDLATAKRVYERGEIGTWDGRLRHMHAEAVVFWHDRERLIDEARD